MRLFCIRGARITSQTGFICLCLQVRPPLQSLALIPQSLVSRGTGALELDFILQVIDLFHKHSLVSCAPLPIQLILVALQASTECFACK